MPLCNVNLGYMYATIRRLDGNISFSRHKLYWYMFMYISI